MVSSSLHSAWPQKLPDPQEFIYDSALCTQQAPLQGFLTLCRIWQEFLKGVIALSGGLMPLQGLISVGSETVSAAWGRKGWDELREECWQIATTTCKTDS